MTSNLALKVGRSLFEKHLDNYTPTDPLYETYVDKKGKESKEEGDDAAAGEKKEDKKDEKKE